MPPAMLVPVTHARPMRSVRAVMPEPTDACGLLLQVVSIAISYFVVACTCWAMAMVLIPVLDSVLMEYNNMLALLIFST